MLYHFIQFKQVDWYVVTWTWCTIISLYCYRNKFWYYNTANSWFKQDWFRQIYSVINWWSYQFCITPDRYNNIPGPISDTFCSLTELSRRFCGYWSIFLIFMYFLLWIFPIWCIIIYLFYRGSYFWRQQIFGCHQPIKPCCTGCQN